MNDTRSLLVATGNRHKTEEIAAVLGPTFVVRDLAALPEAPEVEETGDTFLANARLKALAISRLVPDLVLADDSGLEVDALDGAPGVRSARYAGPGADDGANNAKLIAALDGLDAAGRGGRFRCVMVVARGGEELAHFDGAVEGRLLAELRGSAGFGYDPLFVPDGYEQTFAELGPAVKNRLSHRARALEGLQAWLADH